MSAEPRQTSAPELKAQIEAERGGRPFLVFRDGDGEQRIVVVERGRDASSGWVVARPPALRLDWDEEVSALHAQIEVVGGECTLLDDGLSRNGSFVGDRARPRSAPAARRRQLRFGRTRVLFRRPGEGGGSAPEATVVATEVPDAASVSPGQRRVLVALCRPFKDGSSFATPRDQPGDRRGAPPQRRRGQDPHAGRSFEKLGSRTCRRTASASPWSSGRCRAASIAPREL